MLNWYSFFFALLCMVSGLYSEQAAPSAKTATIERVALEELANRYDAFFLDAYGVFWGSSEVGVLPGAADAMRYLVDRGKYVGILSNSTQRSSREMEKLRKHGLYEGIHYHFILTSGEVAKELLQQEDLPFPTPRHTFWVFGAIHPRFGSHAQLFEGTRYLESQNLDEADFIYISIPHIEGEDQLDSEVFRPMVQVLPKNIPILCVNPDRVAMEGAPPRPVVRQGSIAQIFREEGAAVYLIGKPSQIIFEAALKRLPSDIDRKKILMIGDTPETDIRGAFQSGLDAALVTETGIFANCLAQEEETVIEQLPISDQPRFFLKRLQRDFSQP